MTSFDQITSIFYIFDCWDQFKKGKRKRKDIQHFEMKVEDHLFKLYTELASETYKHGSYHKFLVFDPKKRHISKAQIRDRLEGVVIRRSILKPFLWGISSLASFESPIWASCIGRLELPS
ncbi:hypothetical protein [Candidatus Neptunochlamydia vexilliferae]|uniref:Uncharacterized protein n=1 Tax=Candidatus Neptunichlamydia vexilliferae TaxID=1651774 RepID=A0ABS0AZ63_9BACT|nr:hypothetical protein [Candidatus Neptunochlamydia vexilliferae]MBF5059416.1 hypothetical protein [Candidatus Neptunochlamydia vexilliferae]